MQKYKPKEQDKVAVVLSLKDFIFIRFG